MPFGVQKVGAKKRLVMVLDQGSFEPWFEDGKTGNKRPWF